MLKACLYKKDNIDVEAGKTYLAYFNYNNDMKRYEIIGFQNGLLELDIAKEDNKVARFNLKTNEVRVKNNNTKEFENLEEYITKNIKSVQ